MRLLAIVFLLLAGRCAFGAVLFDDGIYLRAAGEPAPEIVCQDGQKVFLGARQEPEILKVEFIHTDNVNASFCLRLVIPLDKSLDASSYILLVAGTAYRQHMLGVPGQDAYQEHMSGYPKGKTSLGFTIIGNKEANEIAEFFHASLPLRLHPGYNLLPSFTPTKPEFDPGEEVTVLFRIRNVGTNTVAFRKGGRNRAARDNQYVFSAYYQGKQVEDIGTSSHFGGMASLQMLEPGDEFEDTISLGKWFAFDRPGVYEVLGSYSLTFMEPDVFSCRTIWDDWVSAGFTVKIRDSIQAFKPAIGDKRPAP